MNKRGLTIPFIIILVISIGFLFTGIYTYFDNVKKNNHENEYNDKINLIIEASKLFVKQNKIKGDITISLCELEKNDLIGKIINPITNEYISNDSVIVYENGNYLFKNGKYDLKVCESSNIYVELDKNDDKPINIPNEYDNVKEILIRLDNEEVNQIYRNKKNAYEIIYKFDNSIKTKYLVIRDTTSPSILVNSNDTIEINLNDEFIIPSYDVTDNSNSLIKTNVINNVDTSNIGNYSIIYEAIDEDDNKSSKTINVVVKSTNDNENYYISSSKYTNKKEITLKIKGINTKEVCVSNNSICNEWIPYKEDIDWVLDNNTKIYVYYKTNDNKVYMQTKDIYYDINKPEYLSSNKVLYGITYNLSDIVRASDESGIKTIKSNNNTSYKFDKLGDNKINIDIIDNANNINNLDVNIKTYKNLLCDNSISSIVNEDGLVKDDNTCLYVGSNPKNYIKINNILYRIVSIDSSNKIKIVEDSTTRYEYNGLWYNSTLKNSLNNYYNKYDRTLFTTGNIYYGSINNGNVSNIYLDNDKRVDITNIGLLTIKDYLKAGMCDGDVTLDKLLNNNPCRNNWLNDSEYWLSNSYLNKPIYVSNNGNLSYTYEGSKNVKMVMYLKSGLGIIDGDGSKNNPYIVDSTISPNNLVCSLDTDNLFETSKLLTINSGENVKYSFDGINFSNNRSIEVSHDGIITAYVKNNNEYASCSIKLYKEYEYRYKECSGANKVYDKWYIVGTSKESNDFSITSKSIAEINYLDHYEVLNDTPCDNCKWVTKYKRNVEKCNSYDDSIWSNWSNIKIDNNYTLVDERIKYGTK